MPCVPVPAIVVPTLPAPLTLTPPALPAIPDLTWCCKIAINIPIPPIPWPGGPLAINPALVLAINVALASVQTFLDGLQVPCPREL